MKRQILFFIIFFSSVSLFGFTNPVHNFNVVSNFGADNSGFFNTGIDFEGNQCAYAVADGEVIFVGKDIVILDLGDGLRVSYIGLYPTFDSVAVKEGEIIGFVEKDKVLHFEILDGIMHRLVNPLLMLEGKKDDYAPEIKSLMISVDNNLEKLGRKQIVKAGKTVFYISLNNKFAMDSTPYNISVYLNGQEIYDYNFKYIRLRDSEFILDTIGMSSQEIYRIPGFIYIGEIELKQGNSILEIEVSDFAGNKFLRDCRLVAR